jgi:hypothetical protein
MSDEAITSNTSDALEAAFIARLQGRLPELEVEAFPDDPDEYRLNHPIGALLVRYHGSKYGMPEHTNFMVQERVMAVEVTLVFRCLNGKDGIYAYLESVRRALAGYQPAGFTKIKPVGEEFLAQGGGEWRYAVDFSTTTIVVEESEDDPVLGGPIKNISFTQGEVT